MPQHGGFTRHVGACEQAQAASGIKAKVVGHKIGAAKHGFNHRVPPLADVQIGLRVKLRPAPVVGAAHLREALPVIKLGHHIRRVDDAFALGGHVGAQILKQGVFQRLALVCGRQKLFFKLFQLHRGEALGIGKALAANKMEGRWAAVSRARKLIIIAEHTVKAQLELADACFFLFLGQHVLKLLFAVFRQIKQAVKLRIVAGFEQAALGYDRRGAVHQGALQQGRAVLHVVPGLDHIGNALGHVVRSTGRAKSFGRSCGRSFANPLQGGVHVRQGRKAVAQGNKITRRALIQADARGETLQIVDIFQGFAQCGAAGIVRMKKRHSVLNAGDGPKLAPGVAEHVFKQPAAHGGHGVVQHMAQGALALAAIKAAENFKVALGHIVNEQTAAKIKRGKGHEVIRVAHLRLAQIDQQRAAGPHELRLAFEPKSASLAYALSGHNALCGAFEVKLGYRHAHKPYAFQNATLGRLDPFRHQ